MFVSLSGRALVCALGLVAVLGSIPSAIAKEASSDSAEAAAVVDLFDGVEEGKIEATVIPRDSKKVTLQLKNNSDKPVTIRLPEAFAAVPVQAQIGAGGGLFGGGNGGIGFGQGAGNQPGGQGGGTQGLGVNGGGRNGGGGPFGGGGPAGGRGPFGGGAIFNVPAGKVIKVKLTSVCLEYGKPEPHARNEYVIKPIETLCDKPEVVSILRSMGNGEVSQEVAQLAAWNVANGTSFEQIASLKSKLGQQLPVYSQSAISAAAELVKLVSTDAKMDARKASASASASAGR